MQYKKRLLFLTADIGIITAAYWLAAFLRWEGNIPQEMLRPYMLYTLLALVISVFLSIICGCYSSLWQYAGVEVMFRQGIMSAFSSAILLALRFTIIGAPMSGSISVIYGILLFVMSSGVRTASRSTAWLRSLYAAKPANIRRAIVVGAGDTGAMLIKRARDAQSTGEENWLPVAVIDNDTQKIGLKICGIKVVGDINVIEDVCKKYNAHEIIIALPNTTSEELYDIYRKCVRTNLPIKSCQNFMDVKNYLQKDNIALKKVTIEDLLFRDVVQNDMSAAEAMIKGRVIMVTGGAGSIGSELCRQSLVFGCEKLIVYDFDENGLYAIDEGLNTKFKGFERSRYELCLGSVRDIGRLNSVISKYKPDVVFHAAAHKHVPMMEFNPFEAIKNNVAGTKNVIASCIANEVKKFILISTDKAVNPANIMGASKRLAELILKNISAENKKNTKTELAAVRFGNVLDSNGSVIPKFKHQIDQGGPLTLTDKEMIRYFMTIPEAVGLVLTAGALAKGGEIFVLDMGRPVKIYDLATDLIRLAGYEPEVDIKIEVTGVRPGEKLYEELFLDSETIDKTSYEKIFVLKNGENDSNKENSIDDFNKCLENIIVIAEEGKDENAIREAVFGLISDTL